MVLRKCGVTWFTARELWRLQHGDVAEADARFDAFVKLHPSASYEDLAGVAGDAIASVWADAAAFRSSSRCAMVTVAAMKRIAKWAEAQLRSLEEAAVQVRARLRAPRGLATPRCCCGHSATDF